MKMRAISIRQPWATLIVEFGKDIENRCWPTKYRGPLLIHAAKGMTTGEWEDAIEFARPILRQLPKSQIEAASQALRQAHLLRGGIVGFANLTNCADNSESPWFMGKFGFKLEKQTPLPFLACKGALSLFTVDVPDDYLAAIPGFKASP